MNICGGSNQVPALIHPNIRPVCFKYAAQFTLRPQPCISLHRHAVPCYAGASVSASHQSIEFSHPVTLVPLWSPHDLHTKHLFHVQNRSLDAATEGRAFYRMLEATGQGEQKEGLTEC